MRELSRSIPLLFDPKNLKFENLKNPRIFEARGDECVIYPNAKQRNAGLEVAKPHFIHFLIGERGNSDG
jgi:hypothetical protein